MDQLIDFDVRYNENGESLCQAYTYVDTENEGLCNRKANAISLNLNQMLYDYTGVRTTYNCCMLCKQHTASITKKLIFYLSMKLLSYGLKKGIGESIGMTDWNSVDYEGQKEAIKKIMKDGSKKKNKRRKSK
jgi:hypothetical protein